MRCRLGFLLCCPLRGCSLSPSLSPSFFALLCWPQLLDSIEARWSNSYRLPALTLSLPWSATPAPSNPPTLPHSQHLKHLARNPGYVGSTDIALTIANTSELDVISMHKQAAAREGGEAASDMQPFQEVRGGGGGGASVSTAVGPPSSQMLSTHTPLHSCSCAVVPDEEAGGARLFGRRRTPPAPPGLPPLPLGPVLG